MRLVAFLACVAFAGTGAALAQDAATRLEAPKVRGLSVDHCADIDAERDCSQRGEAKAALNACIENGYREQKARHWHPASGTAMHFITEYDMHAGEVGGRWVEMPTDGTFDWIACGK